MRKVISLTFLTLFYIIFAASIFTGKTLAFSGNLSASPSSCQFPCSITLSWSTTDAVETIRVIHSDGSDVSELPGALATSGSQAITIPNGNNIFELYIGSNRVSQVSVTNVTPTPIPPTSTPTLSPIPTTKTCNQTCGASNEVCQSGLYCATVSSGAKYCRLQAYPDRTDCSVPGYSPSTQGSSNAPTPTISASVLGAKTASYVSPSPIASATAVPSQVLGESTDSLSPSTNEATPTPQESGSWLVNNLFLKIIAGLGGIIILVSLAVMIKLNGRSNSV